jgi:ribosomal protein S18 acetylase RimI-like enzyme
MPRLTDPADIRARLRRDPLWSVYALGDLAPAMFPKGRWFSPDLTLVLHDYGTSILFAIGTGSVQEALTHVTWPVHLQVQADALAEVTRHAEVDRSQLMWRMGWTGAAQAAPAPGVVRLASADVPALHALYADGDAAGDAPDFFFPSMVSDGVFFGIYDGAALVAAAGTHLVSREEGAAAVGNVYTRRDRRGIGLGRAVTSAVVSALDGIPTIGLNVRADNAVAIRMYETLGFSRYCRFHEAVATNPRPSSPGFGSSARRRPRR